ncbi:DUF4430 domain-containing protein [Bacillus sp. FJAT-49736]|uniref:DUF4430 domain-containing protein n=1 Tax=Bacillus sp. FJAT-49736 TaxID=2833582 RepID=UPI0020167470|nr:DUF4430 domain-containing protein [Bacillus sp. FJAT-49736]
MLFKRGSVILTAILLVMFQLSGLFSQTVSAATLKNAAMITVVDEKGNTILPHAVLEIKDGETAFEFLKEATSKENVVFDYSMDPNYGASVQQIGQSKPDFNKDGTYWGFFINGAVSQVGVSTYKLKNGDDLFFKVVSYPPKMVTAKVSAKDAKGNAVISDTEVKVVDGANAYDALVQAALVKKINLNIAVDSSYFEFIQNIGNTKLMEGDFWKTALNGKDLLSSLSTNPVKDGDHVQLSLDNYLTPPDPNTGKDNENGTGNSGNTDGQKLPSVSKQQLSAAINKAVAYVEKNGGSNEFELVALQKSGKKIPTSYLKNIKKTLKENNGTFRNVTDYERLAIGTSASGGNATNIEGYNLIKKIYTNDRMTNQGTNGVIYALLAYDGKNYKVPTNAKWSRQKLVNYLVSQQLKSGGWALYGKSPSIDITSMALAALAPYKNQPKVKTAINKAVKWLSSTQDKNGGFTSDINGGDASETTAQVIIGLSAVGIDPAGKAFTKKNGNLIQHLMQFQQKNGGFAHIVSDHDANLIATTQALLGLTAYQQYVNGKGSIYKFLGTNVSAGKSKNTMQATKSTTDGQPLPNTATNYYNVLALGAILLIAGAALYFYNRKQRVS